MMWHVVFAEHGGLPHSRAARSRDSAIHLACELLSQSCDVRRIIEPSGSFIERPELEAHFDEGQISRPAASGTRIERKTAGYRRIWESGRRSDIMVKIVCWGVIATVETPRAEPIIERQLPPSP